MQSGFVAGISAALDFGVDRVKSAIAELNGEQVSRVPEGFKNSIAALVVHVAGVEMNFAFRLQGKTTPDELKAQYLLDQPQSPLPAPQGETGATLVAKMEQARNLLKAAFEQLTDADLNAEWEAPSGKKISYRYLLSLLPHHQGQHYGHIQYIKQMIG